MESSPPPFATLLSVTFWLQNGDFTERVDQPYMPDVTLALIQELKAEIDHLNEELTNRSNSLIKCRRDWLECRAMLKAHERTEK